MEFIFGLPKTKYHHDNIFFEVYKIINIAHFMPCKTTYDVVTITNKYVRINMLEKYSNFMAYHKSSVLVEIEKLFFNFRNIYMNQLKLN